LFDISNNAREVTFVTASTEPHVSRPIMPDGYGVPTTTEGVLAYDHVRERMAAARNYWVASVNPNGTPHARPIWGGWIDDVLYLEGSPETRTMKNITAKRWASVNLDDGDQVVIVEGPIEVVETMEPSLFQRLADQMEGKYKSYRPESGSGMRKLTPKKAFAWTKFPDDVTKWTLA
jgi:hypothetical protein